ncbi:TGS domain-containing protein, partial [Candidatus Woesearchaeota archaeon]|nr:TGS domain-containing protein [Candidatus Woesearchaeota archaeon]
MIEITLPDSSKVQYKKKEITPKEIAEDIGIGLAKAALAAKVDGEFVDLSYPIKGNSVVNIITFDDDEGKEVFRHSSAHVLAAAVQNLFPKVKFGIGPAVEDGFYYDFDKKEPFTPEDLKEIEKEMEKLVKKDTPFKREEASKTEAKKIFKDQPYKLELLEDIDRPTVYKLGDFKDLCSGPHLPSSGKIKAFKLTKTAGAYWKGDSDNKQLQRIYGISFPDKKQLNKYLKLQEEAEKRDHRKIGKRMNLFSINEEAPGMPFFHDKGNFIFEKLKEFMTREMRELDYEINRTPIILNKSLWLRSGHWDHYKENMYFTKIDNQDFAVKPMNCPGNLLIYKTTQHSYRELPLKAGEFGLVHRHESSGVLSG